MSEKNKRIKVTLIKSLIGTKKSHRATVRGLGLRKINSSVELENTPAVQGMINKIFKVKVLGLILFFNQNIRLLIIFLI